MTLTPSILLYYPFLNASRATVTTTNVRMATVSVPPKASLLGIPREVREKILKHSFKGSLVKIDLPGRIAITTAFQHDIIAACKQLHAEGQNLLIAATTLFVVYAPT